MHYYANISVAALFSRDKIMYVAGTTSSVSSMTDSLAPRLPVLPTGHLQ
jgi:hypothetical protein